jgi:hypothetical protein
MTQTIGGGEVPKASDNQGLALSAGGIDGSIGEGASDDKNFPTVLFFGIHHHPRQDQRDG